MKAKETNMNKNKSILIDEKTHKKMKFFCAERSLKMKDWLKQIILEKIKENVNERS